ncbi:quinone oxidoreductase family protein [Spelaeicoccus albus]|uniref:NADPH2:quinone reductase n=1 Tax=Spelaeicoccus albus TaxID=1280376 RepID=A0A7Z0D2U9_9MICO|nr:quinone oxidoreductase [Spelaeicoccus albus]NYI67856.1 NADPH2:quinone reductase [Spelaeicoccus albus]
MAQAIQAMRAGGPEVLEFVDVADPVPDAGQLLVKTAGAGVNFIDTYKRSGVYPMDYPHIPGSEGAGTVAAVGEGVTSHAVGDRVAWHDSPGSYSTLAVVNAARALTVPDGVDDTTAAAIPLQGLTAQYLATSSYPAGSGTTALVHAGAGGVGLLLTQILKHLGARVITTVGTDEKAELSRGAGADDVFLYGPGVDIAGTVRDLTSGRGVDVVYDGVGKDTFDASLESLAVRGTLVLFGGASGQVPPFDIQRLNSAGSLSLTRPTLAHFALTREELDTRASMLFDGLSAGWLNFRVGATYPLRDAARAHRDLEGRQTTGKVVLIP